VLSAAVAVASQDVTVVLGAHARELTHLLGHLPVSFVVNREWEQGIASSIRRGLEALPPACEAAMIVLGDQIALTPEDLQRLVDAWKGDSSTIAASVYAQTVGVPAIFPAAFFPELALLRGDQGARRVLERNQFRLTRVAIPNAAADLDTPEDLARLTQTSAPVG